MQISGDKKEKLEEQVFLKLCPDRYPPVRKVRTGIQACHMGEKRQEENRLEMLEPADRRSEEMRQFGNAGRGGFEQGGNGGNPPYHKE